MTIHLTEYEITKCFLKNHGTLYSNKSILSSVSVAIIIGYSSSFNIFIDRMYSCVTTTLPFQRLVNVRLYFLRSQVTHPCTVNLYTRNSYRGGSRIFPQ